MSWSDLPPDLLRLVSGRLREAGDFVRFHSACQAWRDAAPATFPQFLPWLLAPGRYDDPPSTSQLRSIFSKTTWFAPRTYSLRSRWLAAEDGAGAWLLTMESGTSPSLRLVDPFTGAATALPPFAGRAGDGDDAHIIPYDNGIVLADGTVVLLAIEGYLKYSCFAVAAVLRPGGAAWVEGHAHLVMKHPQYRAAAYHDGAIVLAGLRTVETVKLLEASGGSKDDAIASVRWDDAPWENTVDPELQPRRQRIYTFKSRGELLAACLLLPDTMMEQGGAGDLRALALAGAMSVSVYALEPGVDDDGDGGGGNNPRWVERDARSLGDRVLFLGCPTSFAVDAARLGGAGCAYFVLSSRKPPGAVALAWRKAPKACHVYRYSFEDGGATAVEELPTGAGWDDVTLMTWLAPRPAAIAPVHEIRERLLQDRNKQQGTGAPRPRSTIRAPRTAFGPQFTFFVGNLPRGVGRLDLEQFFARFGRVTDARVKSNGHHACGYWSFGFVTMAPTGEPDDVFAALDGEYFFGHILQMKFAEERPKGPFVMPLLAQTRL
ncbi:unnamed protein product [Urochloa decumbens]|uniref:RRM domain-containing protein n=1 Tax=Urochloa decumbens TaxID=240449 RepID=A0ABC8XKU1_9POAL